MKINDEDGAISAQEARDRVKSHGEDDSVVREQFRGIMSRIKTLSFYGNTSHSDYKDNREWEPEVVAALEELGYKVTLDTYQMWEDVPPSYRITVSWDEGELNG